MVRSWKALHESLLKIASVFQRVSLKVQNSDIEKCISMASSEDKFISEIFLNGCFSKTAAKIYLSKRNFHFLLVTSCERVTNFFGFFLGKGLQAHRINSKFYSKIVF